jgi:DNA-binding CsgD family transcriptional regulator
MLNVTTSTPFKPGAPRLSLKKLRILNEALPHLYQETELARLPQVFVDVLARVVPAESHGVVVHDRARARRTWHLRPAAADHEARVPGFFAHFHEFTPADYRKRTGTGEALALSDFVDRARMDRLAIYTDYYRPLGLADDLNINVKDGHVTICAAVMTSHRGFRDEEREALNALRPHFRQAWRTAARLAELSAQASSGFGRAAMEAAADAPAWSPEKLEVQFGLTPREAEVLMWVAQGKTNPEVATILGIRPYTVRTHLERVFTKLGVETRHAASVRAIEVLGLPRL